MADLVGGCHRLGVFLAAIGSGQEGRRSVHLPGGGGGGTGGVSTGEVASEVQMRLVRLALVPLSGQVLGEQVCQVALTEDGRVVLQQHAPLFHFAQLVQVVFLRLLPTRRLRNDIPLLDSQPFVETVHRGRGMGEDPQPRTGAIPLHKILTVKQQHRQRLALDHVLPGRQHRILPQKPPSLFLLNEVYPRRVGLFLDGPHHIPPQLLPSPHQHHFLEV